MFLRILLFSLFFGYLNAQGPFIRSISYREGLPTQTIYNLFVDQLGLLYLGTDQGLMSYDGLRFEKYKFNESLSISVHNIQQDYKGRIWCKNFSNQLFYLSNNELKNDASIQKLLANDQSNLVGYLCFKNQLWVLTEKNIYVRSDNETFKKVFALPPDQIRDYFTAITVNLKQQKVYVLSSASCYTFKDAKLQAEKNTVFGQKETLIFNDTLVYNTKGIKNEIFKNHKIIDNQNNPSKLYFNKLSIADNHLWLCTSDGIFQLDSKNKINFKFLKSKNTTDIVEDKEGNLWISTVNEGLFMIPEKDVFNYKISNFPENTNYISIYRHDNQTYIGTSKGDLIWLDEFNQVQNQVQFSTKAEVEFIIGIDDKIYSTFGIYNKTLNQNLLDNYLGKYVAKINDHITLFATYNAAGVYVDTLKINPIEKSNLDKKFKSQPYQKSLKSYLFRNKRSRCVLHQPHVKQSFVGYSDGLFIYDKNYNETEISYKNKPIIASRIVEDNKGNVWVSTSQNGVFMLTNQIVKRHYNETHGLSSNQCKRLAIQKDGLWILTNDGLNFLSFADYQIKNLNHNLNLTGIQINDFVVDKDQLYFATNAGIFYFSTQVLKKQTSPLFKIKEVFVNNEKPEVGQKQFKHYQNNLTFNLQSIHYKSLGDYNYLYRLKPIDKHWESQKAINPQVKYLSLKPGNYVFEAKVDLKDGASKILQYAFSIEKPFWLQIWFFVLIIVCISCIVYFSYRYDIKKVRQQEAVKLQFAMSQLTALRSQMNPHFLFNILNAVQGLIYSNQKAKANEYLGTFSDLIRKTLDFSDQLEITLEDELEATELYIKLEKSRFEADDFHYEIKLDSHINPKMILMPSLIIQPFIENAIKHGLMHKSGQKNLNIHIQNSDGYLHFTIDDNGIGRAASANINQVLKNHNSFATKAIRNRINLLNKISKNPIIFEIIDKTPPETGTRIIIKLPLKIKDQ